MIPNAWPARALLLMAALSGGSCVTLDQMAPRVEALPTQARLGSAAQLAQGRDIYITKCAKCHSPEPVRKYPASQWESQILPEMIEETNLSAAEGAAVRAYVMSVLRAPAT
jgi:mono/diheme cytochrome c family protein